MNLKKMEENGAIDYDIELKNYIYRFVNRNYPLDKEDMKSLIEDAPTEKAIKRQQAQKVLNEAMEEILEEVAMKNEKIIEDALRGKYTNYTLQDFRNDIEEYKQVMLEKLWNFQHENTHKIKKDESIKKSDSSDDVDGYEDI